MTGKDFQTSYSKTIESQDIMSSEDLNLSIKVALLIGVSDYQNANKLPACKDDMELMLDLIKNTNKYDDILFVNDNTSGDSSKEKIASFIRKYQNRKIEEVLFYYTGHGMRDNSDFLFLFSDFKDSKIESTSLRNSELDLMLKSLNPELAVKIVDACHSGMEYIKSNGDLEIILKNSSVENFNKIYFFFSSLQDQPSIAFRDYSIFTKSFVKALTTHNGSNIRYRDIMAHISDDLNVSKHQTPFFILQAYNTEVFCDLHDDLIKSITNLLGRNQIIDNEKNSDQSESGHDTQTCEDKLISQVKEKGKDYCNEQEAFASLNNMIDIINQFNWGYVINELYKVNIDAKSNYSSINDMQSGFQRVRSHISLKLHMQMKNMNQ